MKKLHVCSATIPCFLLFSAHLSATDLTNWTQPHNSSAACKLHIQKVYVDDSTKKIHAVVKNEGNPMKGKLYARFSYGNNAMIDGSDFDLKTNQTADLLIVSDLHGGNAITGKLTLAVPTCTVQK